MAVADASFIDWAEVPLTPGELVVAPDGEQIKLHWKASPGAVRFEVERSDGSAPWVEVGHVTAPATEFSEKASHAHRATYRVRAINANGKSPWSNPAWVGQ
jgi:hypothetical protein